MANNNNLYNAALAGASAGVASRWLTNSNSASYASQAALITEFATEFDDAIAPIVGGGSRGQAEVIEAICSAFWRDRILRSDTDMALAVAPLVALYDSLSPTIEPDSGGGGGELEALPNVVWVQQDATGTDGTSAIMGDATPFASFDEAIEAFNVGFSGQLIVLLGAYGNVPVDPSLVANDVSITGIGGDIVPFGLPSQVFVPPLFATNGIPLYLKNVSVVQDGIGNVSLSGWGSITARESSIFGNIDNGFAQGTFIGCILNGDTTTLGQGTQFIQCRTQNSGRQFSTPGATVDYISFMSFGYRGVIRTDGANDAIWHLNGGDTDAISHAYAALQNANRSIVYAEGEIEGGIWCSAGSLTANRVVTVDVTGAPDLGLFRVYNFEQNGNETITVNGVVCEDSVCTILQIQGGVFAKFAVELL